MSDAEIVKEFLVESYENLDRLDQELIALEKEPGNRDTLGSIFRTIHPSKAPQVFWRSTNSKRSRTWEKVCWHACAMGSSCLHKNLCKSNNVSTPPTAGTS